MIETPSAAEQLERDAAAWLQHVLQNASGFIESARQHRFTHGLQPEPPEMRYRAVIDWRKMPQREFESSALLNLLANVIAKACAVDPHVASRMVEAGEFQGFIERQKQKGEVTR